jgi:hypothetical protein
VFYSLLRLAGLAGYHYGIARPGQKERNPKAQILAYKSSRADPRRLAGQKPIRISGGTWAEGFGYTRPYNESIFKTFLPTKFEDFGKLAGYPQAPYTPDYFVAEMKNKFKIDVPPHGQIVLDDNNEKALVEAWDYFKEQAKELGDKADTTTDVCIIGR